MWMDTIMLVWKCQECPYISLNQFFSSFLKFIRCLEISKTSSCTLFTYFSILSHAFFHTLARISTWVSWKKWRNLKWRNWHKFPPSMMLVIVAFSFWPIPNANITLCPGLARQLNLVSPSLISISKRKWHLCHWLGKSNTTVSSAADK